MKEVSPDPLKNFQQVFENKKGVGFEKITEAAFIENTASVAFS